MHEVLLTSGGMEADALVTSGRARVVPGGRLVVPPIEHPAVPDLVRTAVDQLGMELSLLEVDGVGRVELDSVDRAIVPAGHTDCSPASLVSVMVVNNETGVVQGMVVLVERVRKASGAGRPGEVGRMSVYPDVVTVLGKVPVDSHGQGLNVMSLTGHKLGMPVDVRASVVRRDLGLTPITGGGHQEQGLRSGTQDVVAARALMLAVELTVAEWEEQEARLAVLRRRILGGTGALADVYATLPEGADHVASMAHLWPGEVDAETLFMALDLAGIDTSAGSVRHAEVTQPSHASLTMGSGEGPARSTLRYSLGREASSDDVGRLFAALPVVLEGSRRAWKVTHKEQQVGINSRDRHTDSHLPQ